MCTVPLKLLLKAAGRHRSSCLCLAVRILSQHGKKIIVMLNLMRGHDGMLLLVGLHLLIKWKPMTLTKSFPERGTFYHIGQQHIICMNSRYFISQLHYYDCISFYWCNTEYCCNRALNDRAHLWGNLKVLNWIVSKCFSAEPSIDYSVLFHYQHIWSAEVVCACAAVCFSWTIHTFKEDAWNMPGYNIVALTLTTHDIRFLIATDHSS